MNASVLLCGTDLQLLKLRELLLMFAGYSTTSVFGADQLEEFFDLGAPSLVVLCHSLATEAQRKAVAVMRGTPRAPAILILRGAADYELFEGCHDLSVFDGPRAFVAKTTTLIGPGHDGIHGCFREASALHEARCDQSTLVFENAP